jgi:hypothetical protein
MITVWLRDVGDDDNECWVVCAKGDPGAVEFTGYSDIAATQAIETERVES